ncbi:hypothetical protein GCM10020358_51050 [Amorphoplanes nipponensis]|uniref:Uncharacterized protein n=1 Tax=Actinoplanes nipponensis TaxID=135950 RepID=A0A919MT09_9ACTN|nr:hypothetical protein [Actinoplanes nipponensis]GIE48620.1 hypothetical protein Ani05nite_21540 [Actinoplanes nipponensis]
MRRVLPLVLAGAVALTLGVLGTVALASSLTGSPSEAASSVKGADAAPGVYGTR